MYLGKQIGNLQALADQYFSILSTFFFFWGCVLG